MRWCVVALALVGCATTTASASRPRARPSGRAVHAAFEALMPRASRCLGATDRVTVDGFFDGRTGEFFVERVGTATSETRVSVRECVAGVMEQARVRPFGEGRFDASWTVAVPEVSAAVRAMLADGGAPTRVAEVVGEIDARAVAVTMRGQLRELRRCYEDALRGDASLRGRLELRFTLSVDGRITYAIASGPRGFRPVGHCILGRLRSLAWPAARGAPVDFMFPITFEPGNTVSRDAVDDGH